MGATCVWKGSEDERGCITKRPRCAGEGEDGGEERVRMSVTLYIRKFKMLKFTRINAPEPFGQVLIHLPMHPSTPLRYVPPGSFLLRHPVTHQPPALIIIPCRMEAQISECPVTPSPRLPNISLLGQPPAFK
ncbi:hypothetical protein BJ165DRAFT_1405732 [Panaeolus papilionaceus]|nr:hypothetical protein BJ165DRAFT_1405732 [Panaeolus papilionaceus]